MTFLQRAATLAVMTMSLAGLLATSSPGLASDLDRTAISVSPGINALIPAVVPTPEPSAPAAAVEATDPDPEYASLAEAVAAQDDATDDDAVRCLAGAIYYESKGEPLAGQLAVANVIINRSKSGRFPADVCSVVTQRGQFSFVRGGEIPTIDTSRAAYRTAVAVAKVALASAWDGPASKALYFNSSRIAPAARLTRVAAIGNHVFYR